MLDPLFIEICEESRQAPTTMHTYRNRIIIFEQLNKLAIEVNRWRFKYRVVLFSHTILINK